MIFRISRNTYNFSKIGSAITLFITASSALMASPEKNFKTNCMVCHQLENKVEPIVGPSLVEISHIYKDNLKGYLKWCIEPGKKRKDVIQMPSMAHVGEKDLEAIYHWIMATTKGKKYTPPKETNFDPYMLTGDATKRPRIQRIFLPDTSPASIAVTIDGNHSLCWDTVSCRLRYIWIGGFIDGFPYWKSNGSSVAKLTGKVYYRSLPKLNSGFVSQNDEEPKFNGYNIIDSLPVFSYSIGSIEVTEAIQNKAGAITLHIKVTNAKSELKYQLGDLSETNLIHSNGRLENGVLILTAKEAASFKLTFQPKKIIK